MNKNELRVALIFPSIDIDATYGVFKDFLVPGIPMGIGFLAGYIREKGYTNVKIFDEQLGSLSRKKNFQRLMDYNPHIAAISCLTIVLKRMQTIAKDIKHYLPNTTIVAGSAHPTLETNSVLGDKNIDFVIRGEGELPFNSFLDGYRDNNFSNVLGLSYKRHGEIIHNKSHEPLKDLDILPQFPYDLFIHEPLYNIGRYVASRGCPYRCIFCSSRYISGRKYRVHSPQRVVNDLELLVKKYNAEYIQFHDDNICVHRDWVHQICENIISKGLTFRWATQTRSDNLDLDTLRLMKRAGCTVINLGIETGSERLMKMVKKDETLQDHIKAVKLLKQAKINISGSFILGLPTETREETIKTIRFARKLDLDVAQFSLAVPFPGTELLNMAKKEGKEIDWNLCSASGGYVENELSYVPEGRTKEELWNFQRKATFGHWLNIKRVWKTIKGDISPHTIPHPVTVGELIKISRAILLYILVQIKRMTQVSHP